MFGYGIAMAGQGASYKFMGSYFIMFLTNCVMLDPAKASTIASIALYVEAIMGMIIGNVSDSFVSKMGRRRPFILVSSIVMPIVLFLITHTIHNTETVEVIYYAILAILFRVSFSNFEIPYTAFGAEVAKDYDERTKLRTITRAFGIIGNIVGYVVPIYVLGLFPDNEQEKAWQIVGAIVAISVFIALFSGFMLTKGKGVIITKDQVQKKKNVFVNIIKNYIELAKLKPMRLLVLYKACFGSALALYDVGMIYYLTCVLKLNNVKSSLTYTIQIAVFLVMTPIVNKMALAWGKAKQQVYTLAIGGILGILVFLIAPANVYIGVAYMCIFAVVQTGFWQISSSIFYDCVEVDEWVNYKRREGDIMSMVSVLGTLVTAIMVQLFGIFLKSSGYDGALAGNQAASTIGFLKVEYILIPSILCLIAAFSVKLLPITKTRFESLQKAIEARKNGENYDEYMDDVNAIVK